MMKSPLRQRLFRSVGATSLGPILTAVIQLVSVPVFLHGWGPKLYGEWLVLSAIPVYLGLTDFGFGGVASSEMTILVAKGQKTAALEVFQSTWLLTTVISLLIGLIVSIGIWLFPVETLLNVHLLSKGDISKVLCLLCFYVLLDLQWTVIAAGFRCEGNYALGTLLGITVRFITNAASMIAVILGAMPVVVALSLVIVRLLGNWSCQIVLRRKSPWLCYGFDHARISVVRNLFGPAVAYMALAAGNAFSFQGITIIVGAILGPVSVVIFSTVRTLTRVAYQMVDMITNSIWGELSAAFGAGNKLLARNLHRCACQASLGLSSLAIGLLLLFGPWIYRYWTHDHVTIDQNLFRLLLIEVLANSFWFTSSVVPLSCNKHERQAVVYLSATAISLPLAYLFILFFGLSGAGISLLFVDLCMIVFVLRNSLALLDDNFAHFLKALFRRPSLHG